MNTRQKACRIVCPSKTRRDRVECRLADGQCANARKIQQGLDRARDERKQGKIGVSGVGGYGDKG
jgi:hypothetical protein